MRQNHKRIPRKRGNEIPIKINISMAFLKLQREYKTYKNIFIFFDRRFGNKESYKIYHPSKIFVRCLSRQNTFDSNLAVSKEFIISSCCIIFYLAKFEFGYVSFSKFKQMCYLKERRNFFKLFCHEKYECKSMQ